MSGGRGTNNPSEPLPPELLEAFVRALYALIVVAPDEPRGAARHMLGRLAQADETAVREVRDELAYWKGPFLDGAGEATAGYWSALNDARGAADAILSHCICARRPDLAAVLRANRSRDS